MYTKLTRAYLTSKPRAVLLRLAGMQEDIPTMPNKELASRIIKALASAPGVGAVRGFECFCPYCRSYRIVGVPANFNRKLRFCGKCGKASPRIVFEANLERTLDLRAIASKMFLKKEGQLRQTLIQQNMVTLISGLELLFRNTYSLIVDLKHVLAGESIYSRIFRETRNEFLNLGAATGKIKKETALDLREVVNEADYRFLSRMFSARHVIIHNCSVKDRDYISQTGEDANQLNQKVFLSLADLDRTVRIAKKVAVLLDKELRKAASDFHHRLASVSGLTSVFDAARHPVLLTCDCPQCQKDAKPVK